MLSRVRLLSSPPYHESKATDNSTLNIEFPSRLDGPRILPGAELAYLVKTPVKDRCTSGPRLRLRVYTTAGEEKKSKYKVKNIVDSVSYNFQGKARRHARDDEDRSTAIPTSMRAAITLCDRVVPSPFAPALEMP